MEHVTWKRELNINNATDSKHYDVIGGRSFMERNKTG